MSDQGGSAAEKTEQPTHKRIQDARKKGQVAKSVEVVMTLSAMIVLATTYFSFPFIKAWLEDLFKAIFQTIAEEGNPMAPLELAIKVLCFSIIPIALAVIFSIILANVVQFGFLFSFEPLKPEFRKLNPVEGLKRIFSKKTLFEFAKSFIKILILGTVIAWAVRLFIKELVYLPFSGFSGLIHAMSHIFIFFCSLVLLMWILLSIVDFLMQKHLHTKQLMMTIDEVKRENRETEGNPEIKQTRKGIHREIVFDESVAATKKSNVVITNPTHYAAAIYYKKNETPLPVLLAKGKGQSALNIIAIAYEEGIPVIENVALAQALYKTINVMEVVPADLLEPIAEILRWVALLPSLKKTPD